MSQEPYPIDIKRWWKRDRDQPIERFIFTAVVMPRQFDNSNPPRQLIHWRCGGGYFRGEEECSTSFDTRKPDKNDSAVEVQLISKDFAVSAFAPYWWGTPVIKNYTTTDVYNLLNRKKFNQYKYNGDGSGCLTWTTALVALLETEGVIAVGSKASFLNTVKEARDDPKFWVPYELGAEFY